jgi:hypothetical protein
MNRLTVAPFPPPRAAWPARPPPHPDQRRATFPNRSIRSGSQKLHPDIQISYQPIGSGGGIRQLTSPSSSAPTGR